MIRATGNPGYAAYGLLGLPLAMSALPVYVQIPAYYTTQLGLPLAGVGWILFLARFVDALQDPVMGYVIDRLQATLTVWFWLAGIMLAAAFCGLWLPPAAKVNLTFWLALMLILAYMAHSMLNIAYLAWGARIGNSLSGAILGAAAWREGAGLVGVILASVIPSLIFSSDASWLIWYCVAFAAVLLLAVYLLLNMAPPWRRVAPVTQQRFWQQCKSLLGNRGFVALLIPYFINAISVAIPATLVLFFINDRLQVPDYVPAFLVTYFVAAAVGLPLWVRFARKAGVALAWRAGMLLAIVTFISASMLHAGQVDAFFAICLASGFALGADLALPPVLLAGLIDDEVPPAAYYGVWTLLGKLALAISGLALPLLSWLNYHPGHPAGVELAWVYAGIPCALKCVALLLLMRITPVKQTRIA